MAKLLQKWSFDSGVLFVQLFVRIFLRFLTPVDCLVEVVVCSSTTTATMLRFKLAVINQNLVRGEA